MYLNIMPRVNVFHDDVDSYNRRREKRILSDFKSQMAIVLGVFLIIVNIYNPGLTIAGLTGILLIIGGILFLLFNRAEKKRHKYR